MSRGRPLEEAFLFGVAVEARHRAQTTCHCRPGTPASLEVPSEALDVSPARREQPQVVLLAPGDELAKVQGIGLAGQVSIAGEERRERVPLGIGERRIDSSDVGRWSCGGHVAPPGQAETQRPERQGPSNMLTASTYARSVTADHGVRRPRRTHLPPTRERMTEAPGGSWHAPRSRELLRPERPIGDTPRRGNRELSTYPWLYRS
jgi:hypothetical protein